MNSLKQFIIDNLFKINGVINNKKLSERWFKKNNFYHIYNNIIDRTNFLSINCSLLERLYCIYNEIYEITVCSSCKKGRAKFKNFQRGYVTCGKQCEQLNNYRALLAKSVFIKKYGVENISSLPEVKEKTKQTNLKKYGVENISSLPEVKEKRKQTNLERYGTESAFQNEDIKNKIKQINLERYGVENAFQSLDIQNKAKQTNLKKYGVENAGASLISREKRKQTILERYGVENAIQSLEIQEKIKKNNIEKYGVDSPNKVPEIVEKIQKTKANNFYQKLLNNVEYEPLFTFEDYKGIHNNHNFKCKKCNNSFLDSLANGLKCPFCYPKFTSMFEKEILEFVKNIYNGDVISTRKEISPYELDIYIPDKKFAIEAHGIFWHSSYNKDTDQIHCNKHLKKVERCIDVGIKLFQIFENEWEDPQKQQIWKSMIKNQFFLNDKLYARNCEIKTVSKKEKSNFLNENHLQGNCGTNTDIGLFYKNELVCLMCFGKARYSKNNNIEIIRFVNKKGYSVVGGFSKLLKYYININKNINSIISYADRRHSSGDIYKKNGFHFVKKTKPSYFYIKPPDYNILINRIVFQKHKLHKILENFDPNLSEVENMYANGYRRIWDAGHLVFELKI